MTHRSLPSVDATTALRQEMLSPCTTGKKIGHFRARTTDTASTLRVMSEIGTQLSITPIDDGVVLMGEIDAHTAPELERVLGQRIATFGSARLEASGVTFMDSSGLRVLIGATNEARGRGGDVVLDSPTPVVLRLIEISGLSDHLRVIGGS